MIFPNFFYFTDDQRGADPLQMAKALPEGAGMVFRHYNTENRELLARELSYICKNRKIELFIAQNPALSAKVDANGCHLPEYMIPKLPLYKNQFPALQFSVACHSAISAIKAEQSGADMVFLSPLFPTQSHPGTHCTNRYAHAPILRKSGVPAFALGGVTFRNWPQLKALGFGGFGAITEIEKQYLSKQGR